MKIAVIADTHFGCRKNSKYFAEYQSNYFNNFFFPYLYNNDIEHIIHLGDFFDNRKSLNFEIYKNAIDCFVENLNTYEISMTMIIGNHDMFFKTTNEVVSTKLLFSNNNLIEIIDKPVHCDIGGVSFLMVPWIYPAVEEKWVDIIKLSHADICCGHFDIVGAKMNNSRVSDKGLSIELFDKFERVFSGHYHSPSEWYIGSPYQMTWNDYGDRKRFIVFDTTTKLSEDIYNDAQIFYEVEYPSDKEIDFPEGAIVKAVVKEAPSKDYESWLSRIEERNPYRFDIKEEYLFSNEIEDIDYDISTIGIITEYIDSTESIDESKKDGVKKIMNKLYEKVG